jgi:glycosyltransferase involved in cell wall biosynthesis
MASIHTPPTILHLIDTTGPGGAETVFLALAKACEERGMRSIAVIRGPGWVENQLKIMGIDYHVINSKGSFNWRYLRALLAIARAENVQLVQCHLLGSNVYGSLLGLILRKPVVATFHGHVDISPDERLLGLKLGLIAFAAKKVIAVTQDLAEEIKKQGNQRLRRKVTVIPNGIDTTSLESIPLRKQNTNTTILGCLGNVRPAKNYQMAIGLVNYLKQQGTDTKLLIAGDDTNRLAKELKAQVEALNLNDNVVFLGFIDNINAFFNQIDLFLMTSSTEGHPLAITQALASGKPILTTPNGVEKIIDPDLLNVSKEHTVESLAAAFKSIIESGPASEQEASAKRGYVRENFSLEAMIAGYFSFYRKENRPA